MSDPSQVLTAAAAQIAQLQGQLSTANTQVATLTQQNSVLSANAATLTSENTKLKQALSISDYNQNIAVSNAIAPLNAQIKAEKQKQIELQGQIDARDATIVAKDAEIEAISSRARTAENSLSALQEFSTAQVAGISADLIAEKNKNAALEGQLGTISASLESTNAALAIARASSASALDAQRKAEESISNLSQSLSVERNNSENLRVQLSVASAKASTAGADVSLARGLAAAALNSQREAEADSAAARIELLAEQGKSAGLQAELDVIKAPVGAGIIKTSHWFKVLADGTEHPTQMEARAHIIATSTGMSRAAARELMLKHGALEPTINGA